MNFMMETLTVTYPEVEHLGMRCRLPSTTETTFSYGKKESNF